MYVSVPGAIAVVLQAHYADTDQLVQNTLYMASPDVPADPTALQAATEYLYDDFVTPYRHVCHDNVRFDWLTAQDLSPGSDVFFRLDLGQLPGTDHHPPMPKAVAPIFQTSVPDLVGSSYKNWMYLFGVTKFSYTSAAFEVPWTPTYIHAISHGWAVAFDHMETHLGYYPAVYSRRTATLNLVDIFDGQFISIIGTRAGRRGKHKRR